MESFNETPVRQISYEQWCEAAIPRSGWTWRVVRTDVKGIFLKNTYLNGKVVTSSSMNVLVECRHMRARVPVDAA